MTATLDISKLRELHAYATRGPWQARSLPDEGGSVIMREFGNNLRRVDDGRGTFIDIDAALIAYLRTHLPEIIEHLEHSKHVRENLGPLA